MSWLSDLIDAIADLFGGGSDKSEPKPSGTRVNIRVRKEGGGNVSIGGALVTISIRGDKKTRGTNSGGWVRFEDVDQGPRHLWVVKKGYEDYDQHFEVKGTDTTLTVAIGKKSSRPSPSPSPSPSPGPTPPMTSDKVTALRRVAKAYPGEYSDAHGNHGQPGAKYEAFVRRAAACLHYGAPTLGIRADSDVKLNGKRRTDTLSQDALWTPGGIYDFIIAAGTQGTDVSKIVWNKVDDASNGKAIQPDKALVPKASGGSYVPPQGSVRAQRHAFSDRRGQFIPVGASMFCAPWLLKHDTNKLDANLKWLADRRVDFVRYILELSGPYWKDREQNPLEAGFEQRLAALIDKVYSYGMRSQITIFGEWEHSNTESKRRTVVEMVARVINGREPKILYVEMANEAGKPGRWNNMREIRSLATLFKSREPNILVSLTAPQNTTQARQLYEGSNVDVGTVHVERVPGSGVSLDDVSRIPGFPALRSSGEPRGPKASAGGDVSDPDTLVADFKDTIKARVGAYVYHSRAGVGMGSKHWPEPNLWSHPTADAAVKGIIAARNAMRGDQVNR